MYDHDESTRTREPVPKPSFPQSQFLQSSKVPRKSYSRSNVVSKEASEIKRLQKESQRKLKEEEKKKVDEKRKEAFKSLWLEAVTNEFGDELMDIYKVS